MAWLTTLVLLALALFASRRAPRKRAAIGLLAGAITLLALAVVVSLQACQCSEVLRAETLPDVRFALQIAGAFALAGLVRCVA